MFGKAFKALACIFAFISLAMTGGVYAVWKYAEVPAENASEQVEVSIDWTSDYAALNNALMKFLRILNNIDDPNDYQTLCDIFATGTSGWGTDGSYTGNVSGSSQASNVTKLFDNELTMTIYDNDIKVTVLLKR